MLIKTFLIENDPNDLEKLREVLEGNPFNGLINVRGSAKTFDEAQMYLTQPNLDIDLVISDIALGDDHRNDETSAAALFDRVKQIRRIDFGIILITLHDDIWPLNLLAKYIIPPTFCGLVTKRIFRGMNIGQQLELMINNRFMDKFEYLNTTILDHENLTGKYFFKEYIDEYNFFKIGFYTFFDEPNLSEIEKKSIEYLNEENKKKVIGGKKNDSTSSEEKTIDNDEKDSIKFNSTALISLSDKNKVLYYNLFTDFYFEIERKCIVSINATANSSLIYFIKEGKIHQFISDMKMKYLGNLFGISNLQDNYYYPGSLLECSRGVFINPEFKNWMRATPESEEEGSCFHYRSKGGYLSMKLDDCQVIVKVGEDYSDNLKRMFPHFWPNKRYLK
jgi:hypothetical protein